MANIDDLLEQIQSAIYGKEVRGAIHDAIQQCYEDTETYRRITSTIAPTFDPSTPYVTGKHVWYYGTLYRFRHDHAAGEWSWHDIELSPISEDIEDLENIVWQYNRLNCCNLLNDYSIASGTQYGVTCTYNTDGSVTFSGTNTHPDGGDLAFFYLRSSAIPSNLEKGGYYRCQIDSNAVAMIILWHSVLDPSPDQISVDEMTSESTIHVPEAANYCTIYLRVLNGATVNETVHPYIFVPIGTEELSGEVEELKKIVSDQLAITQMTTINALPDSTTTKLQGASYARSVYASVGDAKIITVSKTAGTRFSVSFSAANPASGVSVNGYVEDNTGSEITAEVPDGAKYVIAYVWNANRDTSITAEEMIASVSMIGISGAKDSVARDEIDEIEAVVAQTADIATNAKEAVDAVTYETQRKNLFDGKLNAGYVVANGTLINNGTYKHTNKIDVHNLIGQTVRAYNFDALTYIRFVTIYDQSGTAKESLGTNTNGQSFTIPAGAYYMVCSFAPSSIDTGFVFLTTTDETLFVPHHDERQIDKYDATLGYIATPEPDVLTADSLADDGLLTGMVNSVKTYGTYCFYCKPGAMTDDEYIIFGKDGSQGYGIGISATKWAWFVNGINQGGGTHGLTITDYLFVTVDKVPETGAVVHIYTNGGHYTRTNTSWADNHGAPFVSNQSGATIADVKMTWTAKTLRNRIWIFGDSYVSGSDKRWPYYIYDWKFDENLMINGYPGEDAVNAYKDFCSCLRLGTPSIAIWALGMNNPDDGAINADWLKYTQAFIGICKAFDIAPILATIPNCPDANHHLNQYKNAWIRGESGCRYIEFANAVNIEQDSTTWYDNMLSSDNIHPDVQGAIVLASQVLVDVPEIVTR